jgi:hypothetical protein
VEVLRLDSRPKSFNAIWILALLIERCNGVSLALHPNLSTFRESSKKWTMKMVQWLGVEIMPVGTGKLS